MALPVTGTVIANWSDWRGRSGVEPIRLTPTAQLAYHDPTNRAFVSTDIRLYPNADGEATAVVLATDSEDISPEGWGYEVSFPRSWGVPSKVILVPAGTTVDLFAAAGVVPEVDVMAQVVLSVNGIQPDETGDVTIGGGDDYLTEDEADALYAPISHTHPMSQVTGLTAELTSLDGAVAAAQTAADVAGATAEDAQSQAAQAISDVGGLTESLADTDGALQALDVEVGGIQTALGLQDDRISELEEAPGPARLKVRQAYITDGSGATLPDTGGSWQPLTGFELSIPAAVGDYVELGISAMRSKVTTAFFSAAVLGGSNVRYLSSGTSTPAAEGDPAWYPWDSGENSSSWPTQSTPRGFVVQASDLSAGSVTFAVVVKAAGAGTLYATTDYPFYWQAKNFGPVD